MDLEFNYLQLIKSDIRFSHCYKTCMNCGICSAICPASHLYPYNPREIYSIIQKGNNTEIKYLLSSDAIWECGQCLSCKPRCPRNNVPGVLIQILRKVSQQTGLFSLSNKGKLQKNIARTIGKNLFQTGYCITPDTVLPHSHPELGPVWEWIYENQIELYAKFRTSYQREEDGPNRIIPSETIKELQQIFEETKCINFIDSIMEGESWQ